MPPKLQTDYGAVKGATLDPYMATGLGHYFKETTLVCDPKSLLGRGQGIYIRLPTDGSRDGFVNKLAELMGTKAEKGIQHPVTGTQDGAFVPLNPLGPTSHGIQLLMLQKGAYYAERDGKGRIHFTRPLPEPKVLPEGHDCYAQPKLLDPIDRAGVVLRDRHERLVISLDGKSEADVASLQHHFQRMGPARMVVGGGDRHPITGSQAVMYVATGTLGRDATTALQKENIFTQHDGPDRWGRPAEWMHKSGHTLRDHMFVQLMHGGIEYGQRGMSDTVTLQTRALRDPVLMTYLERTLMTLSSIKKEMGEASFDPATGRAHMVANVPHNSFLVMYLKKMEQRYAVDALSTAPHRTAGFARSDGTAPA